MYIGRSIQFSCFTKPVNYFQSYYVLFLNHAFSSLYTHAFKFIIGNNNKMAPPHAAIRQLKYAFHPYYLTMIDSGIPALAAPK